MKKIIIEESLEKAVGSKLQFSGITATWTHPVTGEPFSTVRVHAKDLKEYFNVSLRGTHDNKEFMEDMLIDFKGVEVSVDVQARNGFQGQAASAKMNFKFSAAEMVVLEKEKKPAPQEKKNV